KAQHYAFEALPNAKLYSDSVTSKLSLGSVEELKETYNSRTFLIKASAPANLFIKDAYSPYWKAEIDKTPATVERVLTLYKMIPVPMGEHRVTLRFHPFGVVEALLINYLLFVGFGLSALGLWGSLPSTIRQNRLVLGDA